MDNPDSPQRLALVTGASGFVGGAIARRLREAGWRVRAAVRRAGAAPGSEEAIVGDLSEPVDWSATLDGVDAVAHAAGLAHQPRGVSERAMLAINADATGALASAAKRAGARRFLLVSSVRAIAGAASETVIDDATPAWPTDAYGRSKLAGEEAALAEGEGVAILRPAAVCGAGARGAFALMARLANTSLPLPIGGLRGRRAFVTDRNLADAARLLLENEDAINRRFLVAEPKPFTAAEFIAALRAARNAPPRIAPSPRLFVALAARAPKLRDMIERLDRDFVAACPALADIGWTPIESSEAGLARMALGRD